MKSFVGLLLLFTVLTAAVLIAGVYDTYGQPTHLETVLVKDKMPDGPHVNFRVLGSDNTEYVTYHWVIYSNLQIGHTYLLLIENHWLISPTIEGIVFYENERWFVTNKSVVLAGNYIWCVERNGSPP